MLILTRKIGFGLKKIGAPCYFGGWADSFKCCKKIRQILRIAEFARMVVLLRRVRGGRTPTQPTKPSFATAEGRRKKLVLVIFRVFNRFLAYTDMNTNATGQPRRATFQKIGILLFNLEARPTILIFFAANGQRFSVFIFSCPLCGQKVEF